MTANSIEIASTLELYEHWAETYDSDGNVVQMLDNTLFNEVVVGILQSTPEPITLLDLGCGTGRNTEKVVANLPVGSEVVAIDPSSSMLAKAKKRIGDAPRVSIRYVVGDVASLPPDLAPEAIISTLVLEHVQLNVFFNGVSQALRKGGWLYVSDMHPEMGSSRAGFRGADGVKHWGTSWHHYPEDTVAAAASVGLKLRGEVYQRGVDNEEQTKTLGRRAEKWIGRKMLVAMIFDKVE